MSFTTLKASNFTIIDPVSASSGIIHKPPFRLPSQRYPNMVTATSVNRKERRGLIIDVLA